MSITSGLYIEKNTIVYNTGKIYRNYMKMLLGYSTKWLHDNMVK